MSQAVYRCAALVVSLTCTFGCWVSCSVAVHDYILIYSICKEKRLESKCHRKTLQQFLIN